MYSYRGALWRGDCVEHLPGHSVWPALWVPRRADWRARSLCDQHDAARRPVVIDCRLEIKPSQFARDCDFQKRSAASASRPAPRKAVAGRHDRARHGRDAARYVCQYRLPRHNPGIRSFDRRHPVGRDLLRADLCQPAAGAGAHRRHGRSYQGFPDRPDLEHSCAAARRLVAGLRRHAVFPLSCRASVQRWC